MEMLSAYTITILGHNLARKQLENLNIFVENMPKLFRNYWNNIRLQNALVTVNLIEYLYKTEHKNYFLIISVVYGERVLVAGHSGQDMACHVNRNESKIGCGRDFDKQQVTMMMTAMIMMMMMIMTTTMTTTTTTIIIIIIIIIIITMIIITISSSISILITYIIRKTKKINH